MDAKPLLPESLSTREICKLCGDINRVGFDVPEQVWNAVSDGRWNILCLGCFTRLADEMQIRWDRDIQFWPVSFATHLEPI